MIKIKNWLPFLILFSLLGLLAWELFHANPNHLPSTLIGEKLPEFSAPNLYPDLPAMTSHAFRGRVTLLNIWASWCDACAIEHAMLMKISQTYHIPLMGLVYKDKSKNAITWLSNQGNPYQLVAKDVTGEIAMDLGVYGTPETFVIDSQGKIIYRQIGAIDQQTWDETLYPLINKIR